VLAGVPSWTIRLWLPMESFKRHPSACGYQPMECAKTALFKLHLDDKARIAAAITITNLDWLRLANER
jgi:hypothetical protein